MKKDGVKARALRWAVEHGYRVSEDGTVHGRQGQPVALREDDSGYLVFTAGPGGGKQRTAVRVQYLVAYAKYGEDLFTPGIVVRHLDGTRINNHTKNLVLGTPYDNYMDRPAHVRQSHARKAARVRRILSDDQVRALRVDHSKGMSYRELCEKYAMTKSGVSYLLHRRTYNDVV